MGWEPVSRKPHIGPDVPASGLESLDIRRGCSAGSRSGFSEQVKEHTERSVSGWIWTVPGPDNLIVMACRSGPDIEQLGIEAGLAEGVPHLFSSS